MQHIVIVGAGAGGLELATRLGNTLGKKQIARITLVNPVLTHLWKPLWHEIAAGTLDSHEDEINLVTHAYAHCFHFQLGKLEGLQRTNKQLFLAPLCDNEGQELLPQRFIHYDILVIAIGSESHDFNTPGVSKYCSFLDTREQTERFQQQFLHAFISSQDPQHQARDEPLTVAIVGGGATGVELAAELHYAATQAARYGWAKTTAKSVIQLSIIEAAATILANLSQYVIETTTTELKKRNIKLYIQERVSRVDEKGLYTQSGKFIPAELKIWAAGIKAAELLTNLDGLETNHLNQLVVKPTLQTTRDDNIFAFGDCASCSQSSSNKAVPPRAQAAYQQAELLAKSLARKVQDKDLLTFHYNDYGYIVWLSADKTVGNLMGRIGGTVFITGRLARWTYRYLYRKHQAVLHGWWRVLLIIVAQWLTKSVRPRLKLH